MSDAASAPSVVSEMDADHMRPYDYTRDLRPFVSGADVNENAVMWQTFEASLVDDVPVLTNADGDCLAIPIPRGDDYIMQNHILFRLLRKFTRGESRVIVDDATDASDAIVKLHARFAGDGLMERLYTLVYKSAALVAEHAMLVKRPKDGGETVSAKRQAQTFCGAVSPKRAGSSFAALFTRWTLGKPDINTIYAELALYVESNALNSPGATPMPSDCVSRPCR